MKKYFLSICIILFLGNIVINAQSYIYNGDFETWQNAGTYEDPDTWDSPNSELASASAGTDVVSKSTDAHSGTYSAMLETKSVMMGLVTVPGVVVNGNFSANISTGTVVIDGGIPYTEMPEKFRGYYKYTAGTGDSCAIAAGLFKWNSTTQQRDTIAFAQFYQSASVGAWTEFVVDFDYNSTDTPDSILVIASSSNQNAPVVGSILYVDDFSFTGGTVSTSEFKTSQDFQMYPNPAVNELNVKLYMDNGKETDLKIYNTIGNTVYQKNISNAKSFRTKLDISNLPKGIYFVEATNSDEKTVKKLVIK